MNTIFTKFFEEPSFDKREILRYMGVKSEDSHINSLLDECILECRGCFKYKVCYAVFDVKTESDMVILPFAQIPSKSLAKHLSECKKAVLFASTVGIEIDRLISKYSRISPSKAVVFQAIGTERIEALCDAFCDELKAEFGKTKSRFSAGYGDFPLSFQKETISVLEANKRIGISLNEGFLMSPSKSVTAIVGIE